MAKKKTTTLPYSREQYLSWYESMLLQRRFEEQAGTQFGKGIRGFFHVYIGQEAVSAGICSATRLTDPIITAYRDHGLALARGMSANECMAELFGKATGCSKGKGGSMHFFSKEHYFFGGHGIVGAQIPMGAGIAFAEKYKGTDNLCICMFGDGAARQGALYETFNMAMLWKLPVIFICENNQYAMGTSVERTSNVTDLAKIGLAFEMPSESVDGMNPESVHEAVSRAAEHCRAGKGPVFLEIETYRYRGHSVSDPGLYRTKEEVAAYRQKDPLNAIKNKIVEAAWLTEAEIETLDDRIMQTIKDSIHFAEESPFPDDTELYHDTYAEADYPFLME
ncbi:MAG: pyruvate dehydrogenase (acetyl-transferring) E1 component subunit alpha [Chitinophagales bacterium]|nr:pyruvate dehydrogenase (acetyl-transferring) E1 component subunit alpha [Chitinophagales bacterium]